MPEALTLALMDAQLPGKLHSLSRKTRRQSSFSLYRMLPNQTTFGRIPVVAQN
jgi:hypothetical protein